MRLVEIRLLEGPNLYRLEPAVKVEVALGRRRRWTGRRAPARATLGRLGMPVARAGWPPEVAAIAGWLRRLGREIGAGTGIVRVHRSADPGHWVVVGPWLGAERSRALAEAAVALAGRGVAPGRGPHRAALASGRGSPEVAALARRIARIGAASASPAAWIRDAERRVPVASITGTNGKSTTTRLLSHVLLRAGRHVGTTTSDGVYVDERLVDPGDWTGPGGAASVLGRRDVEVAVLETARGGILLRGVGYESNDVSVITNVSADHLDLQGIHTLPELAEVKAVVARITRPNGWCVLNGDDPFVAAIARRVRARVALFSLAGRPPPVVRRHVARGGRAFLLRAGVLVEVEAGAERPIVPVAEVPVALGGIARHNVANVLAAAGAARGLGLGREAVAEGLRDFLPTTELAPGRLNVFRLGARLVIVDFAHNEAGVAAVLDVAEAIAGGGAGRTAPITTIVGTAGDRPDDALRGIGRIAARRSDRLAIKETLRYLRGRPRESVVAELRAGARDAGLDPATVPVYESETEALRAELARTDPGAGGLRRIIVLLCHEERTEVFALLAGVGARPVDAATELASLVPRLQRRPARA